MSTGVGRGAASKESETAPKNWNPGDSRRRTITLKCFLLDVYGVTGAGIRVADFQVEQGTRPINERRRPER